MIKAVLNVVGFNYILLAFHADISDNRSVSQITYTKHGIFFQNAVTKLIFSSHELSDGPLFNIDLVT